MNKDCIFFKKLLKTSTVIAIVEKRKILSKQHKFKKLPTVENVMNVIENLQQNMILRAPYQTE